MNKAKSMGLGLLVGLLFLSAPQAILAKETAKKATLSKPKATLQRYHKAYKKSYHARHKIMVHLPEYIPTTPTGPTQSFTAPLTASVDSQDHTGHGQI